MRVAPLLLLLAPLAVAQTSPRTPATALQRGWLTELLDGDREAAARLYAEASSDPDVPIELRAVALARLVELERLKPEPENLDALVADFVAVVDRLELEQPPGLRYAGRPILSAGLVEAARNGADALNAWFEDEANRGSRRSSQRPYDPRPLVTPVYEELLRELARARTAGSDEDRRFVRELTQLNRRRFFRRGSIVEILKLTLDGEHERAAQLRIPRELRQRVPMPDDPVAALATARTRLDGELARIGLNPDERQELRRLRERLDGLTLVGVNEALARDRAGEAVNLLRSLPVYGELLLGGR